MAAALANVEEDNWEWHTFDTVKGGDYLVDQDAAEILCREAIDAVIDLENMGLPFNRTPEGKIDQRRFGGHTRDHGKAAVRRSCYAADRTGHMILQTLYQKCVKHGVKFFNEFYVLDLVMARGRTASSGRPASSPTSSPPATIHVFQAKAVVFATGGFGKIFKTTSNAHTLTGDGVGIIWRKGLPLEDMEFFQFHPTGLAGLGILLTEAARGEGAHPAQRRRRALHGALRPDDQGPRPARHRRALHGPGGARGPRRRAAQGLRPARLHPPRRRGASTRSCPTSPSSPAPTSASSPYTEPVPVMPTAHYAMGGIPTNIEAEVLARQRHRRARPLRRRRVRLRVGARRQPPRHQLAARHQRVRQAGGQRRGRVRRAPRPGSTCRRRRRPAVRRAARAACWSARTASGSPPSAKELQETMDRNAQVFRTEASLKQAESDIDGAARALHERRRPGQGQALQHRPARGGRAGLPARPRRGPRRSRRAAARRAAAGTCATTTRSATTRTTCGTRWPTWRATRTGRRGHIRLDWKPVVVTRYQPMERKY